jgi:hypothetical protein
MTPEFIKIRARWQLKYHYIYLFMVYLTTHQCLRIYNVVSNHNNLSILLHITIDDTYVAIDYFNVCRTCTCRQKSHTKCVHTEGNLAMLLK